MDPTPPADKEPKEFLFRLWPFFLLEIKGYSSEETMMLLNVSTSLRRLWPIILCLLILLVSGAAFGEKLLGLFPKF